MCSKYHNRYPFQCIHLKQKGPFFHCCNENFSLLKTKNVSPKHLTPESELFTGDTHSPGPESGRLVWAASCEFGTYRLCEQRRFRRACASAQSRQNLTLLAHTSSESRGTFRQKARSLAPLNRWPCAVKICHDGMLEDTNSLDSAQSLLNWYRCYCRGEALSKYFIRILHCCIV